MTIELNQKIIDVQIIRKQNKNVYMRMTSSNVLTVSCSSFVSEKKIFQMLESNKKILEKMQWQKEKEERKNNFFWYLGKCYTKVFDGRTKEVTFFQNQVIAKDAKALDHFYQKECERIFTSEVSRILPSFPSVPQFTLKIRNMKTRWGVNHMTNHTITLNSELLKKDLDLLDYVIIHELCHFYEPNHSPRFWRCVEEFYPKYKEARKRLRDV